MIPRSAALALLLATFAASGCGGDRAFDDPSRPIEVRAGSEFVIELESNRSTGYRWVLVDSAALGPLRLVGTRYHVPRASRKAYGGGGTERWTFRAPSAGEGAVSLAYVGPSAIGIRVLEETARFRVTIR
jgi:inhibitor of cysteine peptidase